MIAAARPKSADELNSVGISTAARILGVSRPTVYAWIAKGRLSEARLGRAAPAGRATLRVLRKELEREARRLGPAARPAKG